MKVLILSTYETTGGAAIAANRLMHALQRNGMEVAMLCRKNLSWWKGKPQSWSSIIERATIWVSNGFSKEGLWTVDTACCGQDITQTREYKEADVIHLHWINQGFISLKTLEKIVKSGKRVVWTMHDEWPLDSIYHYTYGTEDQACRLARKVFKEKQRIYNAGRITFVTCSEWLGKIAREKELGKGQDIISIPNTIDTTIFKPQPHHNKKRVLFVSQNVNDERKGIRYLDEAAQIIKAEHEGDEHIEILALGRDIPYISDVKKMAALYASVDAFVTPSLQDNLPNTIMEAMACGTPCVGFNVGGIPEMIDHKVNGYVARYKDAHDLADGIRYVLSEDNHERLALACLQKVERSYSEASVAKRYMETYRGAQPVKVE